MALKAGPVKKEAKNNASNIALWNKKALELHEEEQLVVPSNAAMPKSGPTKRSQVVAPIFALFYVKLLIAVSLPAGWCGDVCEGRGGLLRCRTH